MEEVTQGAVKKVRAEPTILELDGGRQISSNGLYNVELVARFLREKKRDRWVSVAEIAKFSKHAASPRDKKLVRSRMRKLVKHFRSEGMVLLVEYAGQHGAATAVKIYRGKTEEERQAAIYVLEKMAAHKDANESEIRDMRTIIEATDHVASGGQQQLAM